jgi:hypothetical protein
MNINDEFSFDNYKKINLKRKLINYMVEKKKLKNTRRKKY